MKFFDRLFQRGMSFVGKDYSCHTLWDKYIEFEYSQQQWSLLAQIYIQALRFPTKKLHRYYERYISLHWFFGSLEFLKCKEKNMKSLLSMKWVHSITLLKYNLINFDLLFHYNFLLFNGITMYFSEDLDLHDCWQFTTISRLLLWLISNDLGLYCACGMQHFTILCLFPSSSWAIQMLFLRGMSSMFSLVWRSLVPHVKRRWNARVVLL